MRNSKEILHTFNNFLQYLKRRCLLIMLFPKEMEKLPFMVLSMLAFSFKTTVILENKGMEGQHNWHMQEIKMVILLADNFIENS